MSVMTNLMTTVMEPVIADGHGQREAKKHSGTQMLPADASLFLSLHLVHQVLLSILVILVGLSLTTFVMAHATVDGHGHTMAAFLILKLPAFARIHVIHQVSAPDYPNII